ncbi:glycosyltransferase involved in cell wall biosynthesis [Nitrobacteraceae bacterium AZCC 1564]
MKPKIIFLVTEDWYFWSHRLPMARAARQAGFDVGVATRVVEWGDRIRAEGFALHELSWTRGSLSLLGNLGVVRELVRLYAKERPDIVHHVAMKPVVVGNVAAAAARVPRVVNAMTGLGHLFTSNAPKVKVLRIILGPFLKWALARRTSVLLLQNKDDLERLRQLGYASAKTLIIRGSGIDIDHYRPQPIDPQDCVKVAYVGRMIESKGVRVLIEAHRLIRKKGLRVRLLLVGEPDAENPEAISHDEMTQWASEPDVEWLGYCSDIRSLWGNADIAVLPALDREGLPKALLEAAACGRPLIATDVPGSREIALSERNAIVVPPGDPEALSLAIERLAADENLRATFGAESRRIVESDMSQEQVAKNITRLYQDMMNDGRPAVHRGSQCL